MLNDERLEVAHCAFSGTGGWLSINCRRKGASQSGANSSLSRCSCHVCTTIHGRADLNSHFASVLLRCIAASHPLFKASSVLVENKRVAHDRRRAAWLPVRGLSCGTRTMLSLLPTLAIFLRRGPSSNLLVIEIFVFYHVHRMHTPSQTFTAPPTFESNVYTPAPSWSE